MSRRAIKQANLGQNPNESSEGYLF